MVDEVAPLAEAKPDPVTALMQVSKLLVVFPAATISGAILEARREAYETVLEDIPTWAVEAAAKRWLKGDVAALNDKPNLSFPPSPPQLRALALEEWSKARATLWRYRRLMEGKTERVVPLEDRRPLPKEMFPCLRNMA